MTYILCLDVGGTNPRMAMVSVDGVNQFSLVAKQSIKNEPGELIPSINSFLEACAKHGATTNTCSVSVAGPVENNCCANPTNAKFPIYDYEIRDKTHIQNVIVRNDFYMIANAIATLTPSSNGVFQLPHPDARTPPPDSNGARAVIGPGTGLGVAYMPRDGGNFVIMPSEGGHAGIATQKDHVALFEFIRGRLNVSQLGAEALVSGQGIRHIIDFFIGHPGALNEIIEANPSFKQDIIEFEKSEHHKDVTDETIQAALHAESEGDLSKDVAALVAQSYSQNKAARITMRIFMGYLGAAAADVALHGVATGGLFIAGGIPAKNFNLLSNGDFMRTFTDNWKESSRELLRKIPVFVVTDYDVSFYGCARAALREFSS